MPVSIGLTEQDMADLEAGSSFNALGEDGREYNIFPEEFDASDIAALRDGETVTKTLGGITCGVYES